MSHQKTINVPLNRVEGDLEIRVEINDRIVENSWSSGTMYRGYERILVGRSALDGLVITPRICGICGTSHLTAASRALDMIAGAIPPPDAVRIRNLSLMAEHLQSDMRHAFLMFTVDFLNPLYEKSDFFEEAVRRYEPFKGETVIEVIKETKKILEMIAIFGGQWPHSSYMVPGGIVSVPSTSDILQSQHIVRQYRNWYERRILGCSMERWLEVRSRADLEAWLEESDAHRESDLGFFIRFARANGFDRIGKSIETFISYGSLDMPEETKVRSHRGDGLLIPAGFAKGIKKQEFNQEKVAEHVAYSWFRDYEGGYHPFEGETRPYATGNEGKKYSWAKAPRYDGLPAETGPLAEMIVAGNPLLTDLIKKAGTSVFTRELARLIRSTVLIPAMQIWLSETTGDGAFYSSPGKNLQGKGFGLTEASRGALGHWVRIGSDGIEKYQIITPTAWNASPRDSNDTRGPIEEALIGTEIKDINNPVELGHVVRSFDPCLVCTVHSVRRGQSLGYARLGI